MKLLLISNSTNPGEQYLDYPKQNIREFLGDKHVKALFIPYAAVTFSYDDYELKVRGQVQGGRSRCDFNPSLHRSCQCSTGKHQP